jgi:hypothetical protein
MHIIRFLGLDNCASRFSFQPLQISNFTQQSGLRFPVVFPSPLALPCFFLALPYRGAGSGGGAAGPHLSPNLLARNAASHILTKAFASCYSLSYPSLSTTVTATPTRSLRPPPPRSLTRSLHLPTHPFHSNSYTVTSSSSSASSPNEFVDRREMGCSLDRLLASRWL